MQKNKKLINLLIIFFVAVFLLCSVALVVRYIQNKGAGEALRDAANEALKDMPQQEEIVPQEEEPEEPVVIPIDFETLWQTNDDIIAWLNIPGTVIDYPILYDESDNEKYFRRDIEGNYYIGGSIYIENYNRPDFTDFMTVIYGHRMDDTTMFAQLALFRDPEFFGENNEIIIYTPEKILKYRIFAAYQSDNLHILLNNDFGLEAIRSQYIDGISNVRFIDGNFDNTIQVTPSERIVTLSTCVKNQPDSRYLVQGVLVDE